MELTRARRAEPDGPLSWEQGPIVALDLETTGTDVCNDRIVTAVVVEITPQPGRRDREVTPSEWLADPGIPIPDDAAAIHGITTERARREGRPVAQVVAEIVELLGRVWTPGTPLCAFNAAYDLTLLDSEARRHLGRPLTLGGPVVDPMLIDWYLDPSYRAAGRNLRAVCAHHGVRLDRVQVHTAHHDAMAAARLAYTLARRNPQVGRCDLGELHEQQVAWHRQWQLEAANRFSRRGQRDRAAKATAKAAGWPVTTSPTQAPPALLGETHAGRDETHAGRGETRGTAVVVPRQSLGPVVTGGPARSHAGWTAEEDERLRRTWLAADPAADPAALQVELAERHGRTPVAIRFRLVRLSCDTEAPGRECEQARAEELRRALDMEFGRR